jgi:hypothetical protein
MELELKRVPLPSAGIGEILSPKLQQLYVSTPSGARRIEFDWGGLLWSALQETGVELSILRVSGSENAMDVLSYTGLQRLEIPYLQSEWCYGPFTATALQQCSSLRGLSISVCSADSS